MNRIIAGAVLITAAILSACATIPPNPLSADAVRTLRLDSVKVSLAPNANVSWPNAEQEYASAQQAKAASGAIKKPVTETGSLGLVDPNAATSSHYNKLVASPDGRAYVQGRVASRLTTALEGQLKPRMQTGTKPVKLEVVVEEFSVPSAVQRVIIGGVPVIKASAVLRDAATGAVLAERKEMVAVGYAGSGWGGVLADQMMEDLDVRVVNSYAAQFGDWLLPKV